MGDEKTLPQDESAKDEGSVPATREERVRLATEKGGLKTCPSSFSNEYLDWETIKSDNPFEVLYLDYRTHDRISRTMIDGNLGVIKKFWADMAAKAMSSPQIAKKYGGIDAIRKYPQILQKTYVALTADADAIKKCFDKVIYTKQESLRASIEATLIQGEYTPAIRKDVINRGIEIGLTEKEINSLLTEVLREKGFVPEREGSNDPLSLRWYSAARRQVKEEENSERLRKELDSIIGGILADSVFEPGELAAVKEKGKQLGYSEDHALAYFEKKLLEQGFSPDPDVSFNRADVLQKKLAVIWRTDKKHLEVSTYKFEIFLDGKLHNGAYNPDDYVSITEAATGPLRRDSIKLKNTLIVYMKKKGFRQVGEVKAGNELAVEWRTDWAQKQVDHPKVTAISKTPMKIPFLKVVLVSGLVVAVLSGIFLLKKRETHPRETVTVENPNANAVRQGGEMKPLISNQGAPPSVPVNVVPQQGGDVKPPMPTVEPDIRNLNAVVLDINNRPIENLTPGQTIKLTSEYTIIASPDVKTVDVEENNYLLMPDGSKTPDAFRTKQREIGAIISRQSVTLPRQLSTGTYTHVATVKVGEKINKAAQTIVIASAAKPAQDQLITQREIDDYLAEGKLYFDRGKYELCIEKMKEVIKRDNDNRDAQRYTKMATDKIEHLRSQFRNPAIGGSE